MRILIVENADYVSLTIKQFLPSHHVVSVRDFCTLAPLVAVSGEGMHMLEEEAFDLAFIDGCLGTDFEGPGIVRALKARGVACVGISVDPELNAQMIVQGAVMARHKNDLIKALHLGKLPVERLLAADAQLEAELDDLMENYERDHGEEHQALSKILRANVDATAKNYRSARGTEESGHA